MKPLAPAEYLGEFHPIPTNVPGIEISELMPMQARVADKFAILRGAQVANLHTGNMFYRGYPWQEEPRATIPGVDRLRVWIDDRRLVPSSVVCGRLPAAHVRA